MFFLNLVTFACRARMCVYVCVCIQMHITVCEKVGGNPPTAYCCSRALTWPHALYSRLLARPIALNPAQTGPSVLILSGLGCRMLCYWRELCG